TSHTSIALSSGTASATITLSKADTLRITATAGTIKGTSASISVQPGSGTGWISQKLSNASLAALAEKDFTRDNTITYSDILGLFADAESEGSTVSSATLSSLQALASSGAASALSIPASVRNLLSSVVDGDPANAVIASGNLKVGSTVGQLQTLVSDWFLGADHPSAVTIYGTATYQLVSGTLFGSGGPSYEDVYQGQMGDCWLLASFGATAANDPSVIQNMFTDDGIQTVNGTQIHVWTVEFHDNGVPHYVTVDNNLPTVYGCFFFANQGESASSSSNVLWVPLLEKAYAQLCASGWNQRPQTNAYQSLNGGNASTVLPVLTGRAEASDPYTNAGLISALGAGRLMTLASYEDVPSLGIVGSHDYVLMGYNASTQTFTLVNPWGWNTDYTNDGAAAPGILHLRWSQVHQYFMLDGDDNPAA
ncbi:MAG TPA: C2 family cysteine protease, partial [Gemmata sp.]|nr:C2 family cysteine protease [Gemmata sp.]